MKYGFDYIDGRDVPQTVIEDDFTIQGKHDGTVHVENGTLTIQGELHGTLDVQSALTGRLADCHYYPGRCPGLRASALSGRAAYRSFGTFQPYRSKLFDFIIYILSFFLIFISQRAEMLIRDLLMDFSHHVFFDK